MTDQQNKAITTFFQALSDYDGDLLQQCFTNDATVQVAGRPIYHGSKGVAQLVHDLARNHTAWSMQPSRTIAQDGVAAVEWTTTITDFGGGQARVDGCAVFDFAGGDIKNLRLYWRPEDMGE